jgi:hypothetical protein
VNVSISSNPGKKKSDLVLIDISKIVLIVCLTINLLELKVISLE